MLRAIAVACLILCGDAAHAHEAHDREIARLGQQLQGLNITSTEALLPLLRRADLHRKEEHWQAALLDYEASARIQDNHPRMLLGLAQLHLDQHDFQTASDWSMHLLEQQADHVQALLVQARAQIGLGNTQDIDAMYDRAIKLMQSPAPDHYLEHAQAVLQTHGGRDRAIAIADAGAQELNQSVSLHEFALEQEVLADQLTAATQRIDQVLARNPRLLLWRLKKAELLQSLHRRVDACHTLDSVEDEMKQLPPRRSSTPAMQTVRSRLAALQSTCDSR